MQLSEQTTSVPLSQRELSLIAEMADAFLGDFPEAIDAAMLRAKLYSYWMEDANNT